MTIKVGDSVPSASYKRKGANGLEDAKTDDLFSGKKTVIFGLPGAFTPTCSARHLPGFVDKAAEIKAKGVGEIVCLSVNDAFVMDAWGKTANAEGKVTLVADGNAEFTKKLGLELDAQGFGMGLRCKRFAAIVDKGKVTHLFVEAPGAFEVSSAEHVLKNL